MIQSDIPVDDFQTYFLSNPFHDRYSLLFTAEQLHKDTITPTSNIKKDRKNFNKDIANLIKPITFASQKKQRGNKIPQ